ncbi:MAG: YnbE family lipoprotein [Parvularculaceae bacterium]|nr:MAG: YnbE family lipoprotein [Parvularculaceae bacterium]
MSDVLVPLRRKSLIVGICASALMASTGCATVKVEAPDEPIEINLNVNITQEVRVKMERDVEDLIASNPDIF